MLVGSLLAEVLVSVTTVAGLVSPAASTAAFSML
jgi:hypothetical protein